MEESHSQPKPSIPNVEQDRLITVLHSLEDQMKRQNSLKSTLIRGMIYGLGTVLGATVLVALLGATIAGFINSVAGEQILPTEQAE